MRLTLDDLVLAIDGDDPSRLLDSWRWLVDESLTPMFVTALGDLFLQDAEDHIYWLDVCGGQLSEVATSTSEFTELIARPDMANEWLIPQIVDDLKAAGILLKPGECYGYKLPPILGGEMEPDNFEPTDFDLHFGLLGQIHQQAMGLPTDTQIREFRSEE